MKVKFLPQGVEHDIAENKTILGLAAECGVNIDGNCAGNGTCGKCRVRLVSGECEPLKEMQAHYEMSETDKATGWVLACAAVLKSDAVIEVPETDTTASRKKKLIHLPEGFTADCGEESIGVAVDIGTTTVVVSFWDLETGAMLDVDAMTNPQGAYGADVISRISFATENEGGCAILHEKVIGAINTAVDNFCKKNHYENSQVKKYAVVGNTTMSHLFLNIDPASLAVAPFAPAFTGEVVTDCRETGLNGAEDAKVIVVPNIAGHVGSDITAGIITTDLMQRDKGHLFIDIGTNGEIVLSAKGRITACSTAAGPAFEGSSIKYGMRAAAGAIERVFIDDNGVEISVIGDTKPIGICCGRTDKDRCRGQVRETSRLGSACKERRFSKNFGTHRRKPRCKRKRFCAFQGRNSGRKRIHNAKGYSRCSACKSGNFRGDFHNDGRDWPYKRRNRENKHCGCFWKLYQKRECC